MLQLHSKFLWECIIYSLLGCIFAFACLPSMALANALNSSQTPERLVLAVDDYPPYIDRQQADLGVLTKAVQQTLNAAGFSSSVEFRPWARVAKELDEEQTLSFLWFKNPERARSWVFSKPLINVGSTVLIKKGKGIDVNKPYQLQRLKMGVTRGYSYGPAFDGLLNQLTIEQSATDYQAITKLISGRLDAIVIDPVVANNMLNEFYIKQRHEYEFLDSILLEQAPTYLVCSKRYSRCAHIIDQFNQALEQQKRQGVYNLLHSSK